MPTRTTEHMFALTMFSAANCYLAQVPGHLPWLDLVCAFGISWATAALSRTGGTTTVRACLTLLVLRWASSVMSLTLTPILSTHLKKFALFVQLASFCTLVVV